MKTSNNNTALETNLLRALALMQHNGEEFFILDGVAYEGSEQVAKHTFEAMHEEKMKSGLITDSDDYQFDQFCAEELTEVSELDPEDHSNDYLVLTDEEADEKAAEYISEYMWAFNISFLTCYMSEETAEFAEEILKPIQEKCESGNEAVKALINWRYNKEQIIEDAISADGRGHFLATYDGNENEETVLVYPKGDTANQTFYIYRLN